MDSARAAVRSVTSAPDRRSAPEVGRRARLELTFEVRQGRTLLSHAYAEPPFRAGRAFDTADHAHLILASSAPGVFGGDSLRQEILVRSAARVRLTSQSALQVHPSTDTTAARLESRYRVERGGQLQCVWDPVIPFPGARLDQRVHLELDDDATLFWSDALMSGREARGERWRFARLTHELRCTRAGALTYLERYTLDPRNDALDQAWMAADACYFGTILVIDPRVDRMRTEQAHRQVNETSGVRGAADLLDAGVMLARLMARTGTAFHDARARLAILLGF